ncbi:pinin/SDK/memA/ protein conserved region-domain-containing protein [Trichophaea hybrida]|nr:pinin/SDK/memA/ protein conserved region-domain-containing protein [Trichophaea hybrida]
MDIGELITVASAVVVPDDSTDPVKRLPDSECSQAFKRPRRKSRQVGASVNKPTTAEAITCSRIMTVATTSVSRSMPTYSQEKVGLFGTEEEKQRGKRLFGAILGTIGKFQKDSASQRAKSNAVKRREVEAKLQEKLKARTEELDERQKKEDNNFNLRRKVENRDFEERAMLIRHASLSARAKMLVTSTTPQLFYLPWKLLPMEENTIRTQIQTAKESICIAEAAFNGLRKQDNDELVSAVAGGGGSGREKDGENTNEGPKYDNLIDYHPHNGIVDILDDVNNAAKNLVQSSTYTQIEYKRNGNTLFGNDRRMPDVCDVDVIDEGAEDTVIY